MITVNNTLRTADKAETLSIYEQLTEVHGADIMEPSCEGIGDKKCGKTTLYVAFEDTWQNRHRHWFLWLIPRAAAYRLQNMAYVPMRVCHRCGAASAGYRCGLYNPERRSTEYCSVEDSMLTEAERDEWHSIFAAAFNKGKDKREAAVSKKSGGRYEMSGERR